jgi:hypothetical protein
VNNVDFSDIGLNLTYSTSDNPPPPLNDITEAIISKKIQHIFKADDYTKMFKHINNQISSAPAITIDNTIKVNLG